MTLKLRPAYDPICFELAEHFLQDEPSLREAASDLAMCVQQAVEDWIEMAKQERENSAVDQ